MLLLEYPALQAGLGKLLGLWPDIRRIMQLQYLRFVQVFSEFPFQTNTVRWGHVSAASPILVGQYLYFPVMNGTVYVIDTLAPEFSEKALVALNDLGPSGNTWTLSSLSYAHNKLYARTLKELICIED
jgi:hypothetical protein